MISFSEGSPEHENQDFLLVEQLPKSESWIGAIADGQGGRAGGALAAQLACYSLINAVREIQAASLAGPSKWWELFRSTDQAVTSDSQAGYTTLIGFCITDGYIYGASCGDSAAYLCNSAAQFITLTTNQQKNPQIGSGMTSCTFFSSPLVRPWSFLAATDGVWKYVGLDKVRTLLQSPKETRVSEELKAAGRLPGSGKFPDDFTFSLIESGA